MEYKWKSIEKDGYPYTEEEYKKALFEDCDSYLLRDYLLTDGEDYFIGYWRPDGKAWDNDNSGWVRKYYEEGSGDKSLANIKYYMELPPLPQCHMIESYDAVGNIYYTCDKCGGSSWSFDDYCPHCGYEVIE